jgi:hypothetical protein
VFIPQPAILEMVLQKYFCHCLIKGEKTKPNQTKPKQHKTKKTTTFPKFICNTVSVSFSACRCSSVVVSSKEERKKKSLETVL